MASQPWQPSITFVDETQFVNKGNWYFHNEESQKWEKESTISFESTDSDELWEEFSEEFSEEDNATSEEESPIPTRAFPGNLSNPKKRKKETAKVAKGNSSGVSKPRNKPPTKSKRQKRDKKKIRTLTMKELTELGNKLKEKRVNCWIFVAEKLGKQPVINHYESYRKLIQIILDERYIQLRSFVDEMYTSYIELIRKIGKEIKKDRKAHLTIRWANSLHKFLDSKACRSVYSGIPTEIASESTIRAVTGIIHSLVYDFAQTESYSCSQSDDLKQSVAAEEDTSLYRISGAALSQMIRLRKDTLSAKKGKRKITTKTRSQMESELDLLLKLKESDKTNLPESFRLLDEGNLTVVKENFLCFVREADQNIREHVNESKLKKHKGKLFEVAHLNVFIDKELINSFKWSVEKCGVHAEKYNSAAVEKVFSDMLHELCHTRTKEFFRGKSEADLAASGKVVNSDQSLRDSLKTYSITKKR